VNDTSPISPRANDALALTLPAPTEDYGLRTIADAGLGETLGTAEVSRGVGAAPLASQALRTTVLPRVSLTTSPPQLVVDEKHRYEEIQSLGQGGVGEVTLVKDNDIDRLVALKRLKPNLLQPGHVLRFAEEVRTIGQLEHPNIVPVHDVGVDDDGQYYFVMKYVEGQTLETIIELLKQGDAAAHARFSFEYRTQIFMEILRAVHYAHEHGIVHRDIKPANIMVGPMGEVTVMDWGLAKRLNDTTSTLEQPAEEVASADGGDGGEMNETRRAFQTQHGAVLGTPAYMAPEQALGNVDEIGERSDIYSLCVTFYEFLALDHYLSHKKTVAGMLTGVLDVEPRPAYLISSPYQDAIPIELWAVIKRGMAKNPQDRFGRIDEMMAELRQAQTGQIAVHCPATFTRRMSTEMTRAARKHPLGMTGLYVAVGGLALWGLVSMVWMTMA